jgi:hypothetical protein
MRGKGIQRLTRGPRPAATEARKGEGGLVAGLLGPAGLLGRRGYWARNGILEGRPSRRSELRGKGS